MSSFLSIADEVNINVYSFQLIEFSFYVLLSRKISSLIEPTINVRKSTLP